MEEGTAVQCGARALQAQVLGGLQPEAAGSPISAALFAVLRPGSPLFFLPCVSFFLILPLYFFNVGQLFFSTLPPYLFFLSLFAILPSRPSSGIEPRARLKCLFVLPAPSILPILFVLSIESILIYQTLTYIYLITTGGTKLPEFSACCASYFSFWFESLGMYLSWSV